MTLAEVEAGWCVTLRQPAEEFWDSTPKRVDAFFHQAELTRREDDYRAGVIAAAVINAHRKKGSRAVRPQDFFQSLKPKPRYMNDKELRAAFLGFARAMKN